MSLLVGWKVEEASAKKVEASAQSVNVVATSFNAGSSHGANAAAIQREASRTDNTVRCCDESKRTGSCSAILSSNQNVLIILR